MEEVRRSYVSCKSGKSFSDASNVQKYVNPTCCYKGLTGGAGALVILGYHSDAVVTRTLQTRDGACEAG